ncbi:MAG: hypothetical protein KC561_10495, partial [Myxococcales bacterium]|nr:hypothetical protein [Myxococcales bacterium]
MRVVAAVRSISVICLVSIAIPSLARTQESMPHPTALLPSPDECRVYSQGYVTPPLRALFQFVTTIGI